MALNDEDKVFDALQIRDTNEHHSLESKSGEFTAKTIFIENSLDQEVSFQLCGGRNTTMIDIGGVFVISANTNSYQTVTDYFPKYCLKANCSVVPTAGEINVWIIKAKS